MFGTPVANEKPAKRVNQGTKGIMSTHSNDFRSRGMVSVLTIGLGVLALVWTSTAQAAGFDAELQGQSFGTTNWMASSLQGWAELDLIPSRVFMVGGPINNQTITVKFDHTKTQGGVVNPGIQNLFGFTPASNLGITAGP